MIISLFYLIILIDISYNFEPPENLENLVKIYTSSDSISLEKPVITWNHNVFYIGGVLKAFDYENRGFFGPNIFYPYGDNSYIKPLQQGSFIHSDSIFFTKDCQLRIYIEKGRNTFKNLEYQVDFKELNQNGCYDSLRMYYDHYTHFTAVYNINFNKIIVFNIHQAYNQGYRNNIIKVTMKGKIKQALIYSKGDISDMESVLIGIDAYGQINFWNIKGYCNWYTSIWYSLTSNDLIKSFNSRYITPYFDQDIAILMQKNKLLFVNHDDFHLFDVEKLEYIKSQNLLIKGVSSLLGLKDGNALVGTDNGYLYLITLKNNSVKMLDKRRLCYNRIYTLSSIENCIPDTKSCYKFAANCGNLIIFEIKNPNN